MDAIRGKWIGIILAAVAAAVGALEPSLANSQLPAVTGVVEFDYRF